MRTGCRWVRVTVANDQTQPIPVHSLIALGGPSDNKVPEVHLRCRSDDLRESATRLAVPIGVNGAIPANSPGRRDGVVVQVSGDHNLTVIFESTDARSDL
jgi:hypothetical protein